jgi:hypothetical protein
MLFRCSYIRSFNMPKWHNYVPLPNNTWSTTAKSICISISTIMIKIHNFKLIISVCITFGIISLILGIIFGNKAIGYNIYLITQLNLNTSEIIPSVISFVTYAILSSFLLSLSLILLIISFVLYQIMKIRNILIYYGLFLDKRKDNIIHQDLTTEAVLAVSSKPVSPKNTSSPNRNTDEGSNEKEQSKLPHSNGGSEQRKTE